MWKCAIVGDKIQQLLDLYLAVCAMLLGQAVTMTYSVRNFHYKLGRGCGTVKPFCRKYVTVRIDILQNFVSSEVSVINVFIG